MAITPLTVRDIFFGYKNLNVLLVSAACRFYNCLLTVMVAAGDAVLEIHFYVKLAVNQVYKTFSKA